MMKKTGEGDKGKIRKLDVEKYLRVKKIEDEFLQKSEPQTEPLFVVLGGPVGVGKTTLRREQYAKGYVNIDSEDVAKSIEGFLSGPDELAEYLDVMGSELVARAITERRNIVIEVQLDSAEPIGSIISGMKKAGYKTQLMVVKNDVETSWKNNINRDKDSLSSVHTQGLTMAWFVRYLNDFGRREFLIPSIK